MSTIFISHASADKPFVRRLASSLIHDGFWVWLDSWQLELGQQLQGTLGAAIDGCGCVLLVLSAAANRSEWVRREVELARDVEKRRGESILIPVLLEPGALTGDTAGLVHVDFSDSYSSGYHQLRSALSRRGLKNARRPLSSERLLLHFPDGVDLDSGRFLRCIEGIYARQGPDAKLEPEQIVLLPSEEYEEAVTALHRRHDLGRADPHLPKGASLAPIQGFMQRIVEAEDALVGGVSRIVNNLALHGEFGSPLYETSESYCRLMGVEAAKCLNRALPQGGSGYGDEWFNGLVGEESWARFFQVPEVTSQRVFVHPPGKMAKWSENGYYIYFDKSSDAIREGMEGRLNLAETCGLTCRAKFLLPQMLYSEYGYRGIHGKPELRWDLAGCTLESQGFFLWS